ncbi:SDR family NAD(P)-dependent oxidoreductase [Rhodobaculum claviforme]|uniref:Short-chain dehydrogenase n=1 Tax=Rhodobaculum claviforme TaxID=1549854 RepID=A0A934TME4_9RHOB|nr:SDR family NAD(P)-dependent oxidoreductase [Rhodobaculum claviforme]MBK5928465.1 short-chain dehydrogenase [Rhodobaculum claviforme]
MTQRTILITGCSSGIGWDAARTLSARGWRVFATARAEADCARLRAEGLESIRLDYADPASIAAAVAEVAERTGGRLDALFNNGAFAIPGALEDIPAEALRAIFEANVIGWHDLTCRVIPLMRAAGGGRIVQCSSVLGRVGLRWRGAYVATKFALEGLSDVLRLEMADAGIHVVLIEPGPITSRFRINARRQFEAWVDWRASPRAAQYEDRLLGRLYEDRGPDRFELPPAAVTDVVIRALEARRPRARYAVTVPARMMEVARRLLPDRLLDRLLRLG